MITDQQSEITYNKTFRDVEMDAAKRKLPVSVLFVDDDVDIREQVSEMLGRVVAEVHTAENGKEGLWKYMEFSPDIVITDCKMPVMTGLEMAEQIRMLDRKVQIIVMSAYRDANELIELIDVGICSYVVKPVADDKLLKALEQCAAHVMQTRAKAKYESELNEILSLFD